jgi:hypothetical protein
MVEEDYHDELKAVDKLGIPYGLLDFDMAVDNNNYSKAIENIQETDKLKTAVYRGWMFSIEQYTKFHTKLLLEKGIELINTPEEYAFCHHFPNSYSVISHATPTTTWVPLEKFSLDALEEVLAPFGESPIILKDYVKSAKHYWNTACFIPDASDIEKVKSTIQEFRRVRDGVTGGFVFRQYVELEQIGIHPISKVPISKEYRLFFLNSRLINVSQYWEEGEYDQEVLPIERFESIAREVKSKFFSMDVAKTRAGHWIIIELGDGQVSGLPVECDIKKFYEGLVGL